MSLKWKEISLLVEEARPKLEGSTVQKIAQVKEIASEESFYLQGFGAAGPWRLWVCLQLDHTCWAFADDDWQLEAVPEPSTFVMVLRKHLLGKRISRLEQVPHERFVLIHFEHGQSLLFELMPKRANFLLGEAWDAEKREIRAIHSFRQISLTSGAKYTLPMLPRLAAASEDVREFILSREPDESVHRLVAEKYWGSVAQRGFTDFKKLWRQNWKSHAKKISTALERAKNDLEESREAELFQKRGVALVTHLYSLGPKKMPQEKSITLDGLEIPLDRAKNYSDNAEFCFKKAKKFSRAVKELESRVLDLEEKKEQCARVAAEIEKVETEEQMQRFAAIFQKAGVEVPDPTPAETEKKDVGAKPFLEVQSSDGFAIYCGRNQLENRRVTFQEAKGGDMWMHVKGMPGAHVVIKAQRNKTVPLRTLLEAAQLCLYYSKIRKGKRAEVDYTLRKYVKTIKGTVAEVTYTENKTLYVEADAQALKGLVRGAEVG